MERSTNISGKGLLYSYHHYIVSRDSVYGGCLNLGQKMNDYCVFRMFINVNFGLNYT